MSPTRRLGGIVTVGDSFAYEATVSGPTDGGPPVASAAPLDAERGPPGCFQRPARVT